MNKHEVGDLLARVSVLDPRLTYGTDPQQRARAAMLHDHLEHATIEDAMKALRQLTRNTSDGLTWPMIIAETVDVLRRRLGARSFFDDVADADRADVCTVDPRICDLPAHRHVPRPAEHVGDVQDWTAAVRLSARQRPCPECQAQPGQPCDPIERTYGPKKIRMHPLAGIGEDGHHGKRRVQTP